ncbi:MAG TPA: hypothetical protein G4O13_06410 [Dehalococcoidia bacterium]|nr:hypothetical protein [Dehalococcoidia bacterium]
MSAIQAPDKEKNKTLAAVMAAVNAYMEEEGRAGRTATPRLRPATAFNLWSVSGREEIMRMRTLWQRRMA